MRKISHQEKVRSCCHTERSTKITRDHTRDEGVEVPVSEPEPRDQEATALRRLEVDGRIGVGVLEPDLEEHLVLDVGPDFFEDVVHEVPHEVALRRSKGYHVRILEFFFEREPDLLDDLKNYNFDLLLDPKVEFLFLIAEELARLLIDLLEL